MLQNSAGVGGVRAEYLQSAYNEGQASRIYKELKSTVKKKNPIRKWTKVMKKSSSEEVIQIASKQLKDDKIVGV